MKYFYEMLLRPASPGAQPNGVIEIFYNLGRWGVVVYNRELTDEELSNYDMRVWTL